MPPGLPPYARVALPLPVDETYDYLVPGPLAESVRPGCRVEVRFGRRRAPLAGFVVERTDRTAVAPEKLRPIERLVDPRPIVSPAILQLARWIADYYACSWGEALEAAVPGGVKKGLRGRTLQVVRLAVGRAAAEEVARRCQDRFSGRARIVRLLLEADGLLTRAEVCQRCQVSASPLDTLEREGVVRWERVRVEADPLVGVELPPAPPPRSSPATRGRPWPTCGPGWPSGASG